MGLYWVRHRAVGGGHHGDMFQEKPAGLGSKWYIDVCSFSLVVS